MYEDYKPGFARHKGGPKDSAQYLWNERLIAIHWRNIASADPDDYEERAATEISNLNDFAEDGTIVGASYRSVTKTEMLVGVVEPESSIKLLYMDGNNIINKKTINPGESDDVDNDLEDNVCILKSLQLSDVKEISIEQYPVVFESSVRPSHWSVCNWWKAEKHLRAIINEESKPFQVDYLQPSQVEILCEEYIRIVDNTYRRLDQVGGQTADVDISGISDETKIWAQVTMGGPSDVRKKLDALEEFAGESTRVLMFAPMKSKPNKLPEGVTFLPVESVFSTVALNSSGKEMLERMLNIPTED
jgi:hypothetical protein